MIELEFLPVPIDVIIGFTFLVIFGFVTGAMICLPFAHRSSNLPLEKLSSDLVWRYAPDWILIFIACIIFIIISFLLIGGIWRIL